jgi:hypothetical protein
MLDHALLVTMEGDRLATMKLDRLGRSLEHLIALSNELQAGLDQGHRHLYGLRAAVLPDPRGHCRVRAHRHVRAHP